MQQHQIEGGNGVGEKYGVNKKANREGDRRELRDGQLNGQEQGENQDSDFHQPRNQTRFSKADCIVCPIFPVRQDRVATLRPSAAVRL